MRPLLRLCSLVTLASFSSGCSIIVPEVSTMPVVHNPFPQLSRVAVAPFTNLSDEPKVDGRQFALAYFAELQAVPGFEVVPLGVVEEMMIQERIALNDPTDVRRLGELLGVDAVVVGAVTDFSPYYPPRCGMRVEWYATNSGFHEIPAGYGLPWGTPDEEYIPQKVVFDAELALARAQMATQSPICAEDAPPIMPPIDAAPLTTVVPGASEAMPPPLPDDPAPPVDELFGQDTNQALPGDMAPDTANQDPVSPDGLDIEDNDPEDPLDQSSYEETTWKPRQQATHKVPVIDAQAACLPDAIAMEGAIESNAENFFRHPVAA